MVSGGQAVEFVDRGTDRANILCLFHTPRTGDTTVLDVIMTADGSRCSPLKHLHAMPAREWLIIIPNTTPNVRS